MGFWLGLRKCYKLLGGNELLLALGITSSHNFHHSHIGEVEKLIVERDRNTPSKVRTDGAVLTGCCIVLVRPGYNINICENCSHGSQIPKLSLLQYIDSPVGQILTTCLQTQLNLYQTCDGLHYVCRDACSFHAYYYVCHKEGPMV